MDHMWGVSDRGESRMTSRFLAGETSRTELPLTEVGKQEERGGNAH